MNLLPRHNGKNNLSFLLHNTFSTLNQHYTGTYLTVSELTVTQNKKYPSRYITVSHVRAVP
jgi:hypothetical protein